MTRVLITGYRRWHCERLATYIVDRLVTRYGRDLTIVHGAAKGVDSAFADAAYAAGVKLEPHPARWDDIEAPGALVRYDEKNDRRYVANAGPIRNAEMVAAGANLCLAVHRDLAASKGTLGCVKLAFAAGIPVWLIDAEDAAPKRITSLDPLEYAGDKG